MSSILWNCLWRPFSELYDSIQLVNFHVKSFSIDSIQADVLSVRLYGEATISPIHTDIAAF